MANRSNEIPLAGRNVIALYHQPVYLHENTTFSLELRIEQDPIKVFPFQDMCSVAVLSWIKEHYGRGITSFEHLIPFLLQLRGLWGLVEDEDFPHRTTFVNKNPDMPPNPERELSFESTMDQWYGTRKFRTVVKIMIGDEDWVHIVTFPGGNPEVLCQHRGGVNENQGYKVVPGPPGEPFEAAFAHGSTRGYEDRNAVRKTLTGGGPNYNYEVSWDEMCVCTVRVTGRHPIRVAVHTEQDEVHCPGGWGVNKGSQIEYYSSVLGHICTIENALPYTMGDVGFDGPSTFSSFSVIPIPGLGAAGAGVSFNWTWDGGSNYSAQGLGEPRDTCWQLEQDYSLDSATWDWVRTYSANYPNNKKHYLHMLAFAWTGVTNRLFPGDPTPIEGDRLGYVRCPALCGAELQYIDETGEYTGWQPLVSGFVGYFHSFLPAPPGALGYNRIYKITHDAWAAAKIRLAEYERVVEPPKVKITATYSAVGGEFAFPEETKYFYGTLPHRYIAQHAQYGLTDIYSYILPSLYHQVIGIYAFDIDSETNSDDRFSYAEIGAGVLNCEFSIDREGFEATWLNEIDGIDGVSTIPQTSFYEGENTFIWSEGGDNYQEWLGID